MIYLEYILKIIYYFAFVFFMFSIFKKMQKKYGKVPIKYILLLCILFGLYAVICGQYPYSNDRLNYAFRFENSAYDDYVKNDSLGLFFIYKIIHIFTFDPMFLFFTIGFIYLFFILKASTNINNLNTFTILLIGLSSYLSYGCYLIKQCVGIALIAYAFAELYNSHKARAISIILIATLFHESAWIVLPIVISMFFLKNKFARYVSFILIIVCTLFYKYINTYLVSFFIQIIPSLANQLKGYLNQSGGILIHYNYFTGLKSIPFFAIFTLGNLKKNELKTSIKYYNEFMYIVFFTAITTFLSTYMYWMYRFALYFYFPSFLFMGFIYQNLKNKKEKSVYSLILLTIFSIYTLRLWCQYYFLYGGV